MINSLERLEDNLEKYSDMVDLLEFEGFTRQDALIVALLMEQTTLLEEIRMHLCE